MAQHPDDPDWLTACRVLKTALTHAIIEDRTRGPFPLCHLDFHYGNMPFDNEYNLTGIIDRSAAQAAPLEQLSVCLDFAIFPLLLDEENRPMVQFKNLVIDALKEIEREHAKTPTLHDMEVGTIPNPSLTPLSIYLASKGAELVYREYITTPRQAFWASKTVAKVTYGESVTWEQLREVYGNMPLF